MKQVILSIVIAVISLLSSFSAQADNASLQIKGDSMVVVNGKDTVTISMGKLQEMRRPTMKPTKKKLHWRISAT